ncbi:MAG TPA: ComEC/Rec2 family competence protein [Anaerolineales bacterium]|nr:ComEC/Rec2 family competence protein [Anaerolineales bacterium]
MSLPWAAAGWALGLVFGPPASLPVFSWIALAVVSAGFARLFRKQLGYRRLFTLLVAVFVGAARAQASIPRAEDSPVAAFNDVPVLLTLQGIVVEPPIAYGWSVRFRLESDVLARKEGGPWLEAPGRIQVETNERIDVDYGDRLQLRGWLTTPRNTATFPEADVLHAAGVFSVLRAVEVERLASGQGQPVVGFFHRLRRASLTALTASLPPEEAALLGGVVLGADEAMPAHLRQVFSRTGTTHILAVSGFNVALVAGAFGTAFGRWLGARRGALAAGLAVAAYTVLVGAEPSAVRAAVMAGLAMTAKLLGRRSDALTSLAATGWIMTAWRPSLIADIGFQLSFTATLGLVLFADPFEHAALEWFQAGDHRRKAGGVIGILREVVLMTLAAQLATLPLTAFHFGRLPVTALPANFLILPVQPALMILGSLTAVSGMIWPPLGKLLGWITFPLASYNLRVVEGFARLPLASVAVGPISILGTATAYAGVFLLAAGLRARSRGWKPPISAPAWVRLAAVGLLTSLTWKSVIDAPDAKLHATLFASGDVLIESPSGRFVLLRPANGALLPTADIGSRLPLFAPSLDWIFFPTDEAAQGFLAGRPGDRMVPMGILHVGPVPDLSTLDVPGRTLRLQPAERGARLNLGGECSLEIIEASDQGSAVLLSMERARWLVLLGIPYRSLEALPEGVSVVLADAADHVDDRLYAEVVGVAGTASPPGLQTTGARGWISVETDGLRLWAQASP